MKNFLPAALAVLFMVLQYQGNAQYDYDYEGPLFSRPKAIALTLGTQGVGVDFTQNVSFGVSVRLGASYLPFSYKYSGLFGNVNSDVKLKTKNFANAHLLVDWFPFETLGLRVTPGVGYFFNAQSVATVTPKGNYKYGDIDITGEDIGTMTGTLEWKGLAPYLGAGWLFSFQEGESPISITVDLGTYYLSRPDATLTGTKLLENNSYNEKRFQENVKNYRWLPVLQASLRYTF
ncbi:hypothetical protein HNQ91_002805 [Filimonas zeae]|uniref:Outer membrane protein beta-barrel domain-containing protein n=1 Tax=Filimonas zeae TaxID=1737353 RepID=A0A917J1I3_9BACT|nr:hypothetical protein [Filimonas zeae]MDR6339740.1 hypothetical protein [Filimonas zeae]GGH69417.1 hypothetical protein GCM10011379_26700 [Filimonas zeae]